MSEKQPTEVAAAGSREPTGYAALRRAERYPELKHIDPDLLDEWRTQWGPDPDSWDVKGVRETQLARNMRELCEAFRHNNKLSEPPTERNQS